MNKSKYLIIGAGPAALAAAQEIRRYEQTANITLVTREETVPYSPALLPYLISGEIAQSAFFVKGQNMLDALDVKLIRGKEVGRILHRNSEIEYTDGERETYDKLLIATGAGPWMPSIENLPKEQVHTFRTYRDFERLNATLGKKQDIAVYGAGMVAIEVAEKLSLAGHKVTIIARSSLLRRYFDQRSVALLEQKLNSYGGRLLTKTTLEGAEKHGDKLELKLSTGEILNVDGLVMAVGVAANLVQAEQIDVVDGGIKVGNNMETSLPNIFAAGDVAATPSFFDGRYGTCQILPEAVLQGRIAGMNMAGKETSYPGWISANYLRCFGHHLFSIGQIENDCDVLEKQEGDSFLKLTFKDDYLVAVEGLNLGAAHPGVFLYLIRERVPVGEHRDLLLAKPWETACWMMLKYRKDKRFSN